MACSKVSAKPKYLACSALEIIPLMPFDHAVGLRAPQWNQSIFNAIDDANLSKTLIPRGAFHRLQ